VSEVSIVYPKSKYFIESYQRRDETARRCSTPCPPGHLW